MRTRVAWYLIYMNTDTRYCQNPNCGDAFDPTEVSDDAFCSWDCLEATCGDCGGTMTNGVCDDDDCVSHDYDEDDETEEN